MQNSLVGAFHIDENMQKKYDTNRAELAAIYCGLLLAPTGSGNIEVFTDSLTALQLINGNFKHVKYDSLVNCVKYVADKKFINVNYRKVKAHTGVYGNEIAHILARAGAQLNSKQFHVPCFGDDIEVLVKENIHKNSLIHDIIFCL